MDPFIWPATLFGQKAGIATKKQQNIYIIFTNLLHSPSTATTSLSMIDLKIAHSNGAFS